MTSEREPGITNFLRSRFQNGQISRAVYVGLSLP